MQTTAPALTRLKGQTSVPAQRPSITSNSGVGFCFTAARLGQLRLGCKKQSREKAKAGRRNAEPIETCCVPREPGEQGANCRKWTQNTHSAPPRQIGVRGLSPGLGGALG